MTVGTRSPQDPISMWLGFWVYGCIGEGGAQGYMIPRANIGNDVRVDADQVEVAVEVWHGKSCSNVLW